MCGITGWFDFQSGRWPDAALLQRMTDALVRRGPDGGGMHREAGLGLGHRRLAVMDPAGSPQPMWDHTRRQAVVFNGEIYNFRALRRELADYPFVTSGDTEVLLAAWQRWGGDCVHHLDGMFAFALWDREQRTLFLARDRLGIKPLYYAPDLQGVFAFASDLRGLVPLPGWQGAADPQALELYLTLGYIPDPWSLYRQARKLPPGHRLQVTPEGVGSPECWWRPRSWHMPPRDINPAALRERLAQAVEAQRVADVPLGAFLSGGVDSGGLVALLTRAGAGPVTACTVAFDDPHHDESAAAGVLARHCGARHHVAAARADDQAALAHLDEVFDEPFADSSALPTWQVCALARGQVTVALAGDGSDELFAGYRRTQGLLREAALRRRLPVPLRRALGAMGAAWPRLDHAPRWLRGRHTLQALAMEEAEGIAHGVSMIKEIDRLALRGPWLRRELGGFRVAPWFATLAREGGETPWERLRAIDLATFLPGRILVKTDRTSMDLGLEVRVPYLDEAVVAYALGLPLSALLAKGQGKALLREALAPLLPEATLQRPKQGFSIPLEAWLRGPLRSTLEQTLGDGVLAQSGWIDPLVPARWIGQHGSGRGNRGQELWLLWRLETFLRRQEGWP
ncbi:MAG: asparagine synthase (glutamine-hydrolyzing) [Magnetococcus sp. WYHC-3]